MVELIIIFSPVWVILIVAIYDIINSSRDKIKYKKVGDFAKNASGAYHASINNGWRNEYTWFKKINIKDTESEQVFSKKQ